MPNPSTKPKRLPRKVAELVHKKQREHFKHKRTPAQARAQLDTPPPHASYKDRDGKQHTFDSSLKRLAAQVLHTHSKHWRYRPFTFPLITQNGNEIEYHFDFYVYDSNETVVRLIAVLPKENSELWDRLGLFKKQYPMYKYEIWTPEKLHAIATKKQRLAF